MQPVELDCIRPIQASSHTHTHTHTQRMILNHPGQITSLSRRLLVNVPK